MVDHPLAQYPFVWYNCPLKDVLKVMVMYSLQRHSRITSQREVMGSSMRQAHPLRKT